MKKLIVLIITACMAHVSALQASTYGPPENSVKEVKYCARKVAEKIVVEINDTIITTDVTLDNGAKLSIDGKVTKPDGSQVLLESGECIDRQGKISYNDGKTGMINGRAIEPRSWK